MYLSTNDQERNDIIKKYFYSKKPKQLSINVIIYVLLALITVEVILMLMFQNLSIIIASSGFAIIILYRALLYPYFSKNRIYKERVKDDKINQWLIEDLSLKIKKRAVEYLKLEYEELTSEHFIIIPYPVFKPSQKIENEKLLRIYNKDGYYNYSFWNVQIIVLSKNHLSYYFCSYNWIDEEILNENSNEYFYEDITTVRSDIEEVNFKNKWTEQQLTEANILKLVNISSDILYLITELPELKPHKLTIINQEKAVQAIRMIIRKVRNNDKSRYKANLNFNNENTKNIEHEEMEMAMG